jgi:hypothetical protein
MANRNDDIDQIKTLAVRIVEADGERVVMDRKDMNEAVRILDKLFNDIPPTWPVMLEDIHILLASLRAHSATRIIAMR